MTIRGAYIAKLDLTQPHLAGVADKIRAQVAALAELPAEVDLYHMAGAQVACNGRPIRSAGTSNLARRVSHYFLFHIALATRKAPLDFIYVRDQGTSPMFLWVLGRLRKKNPGLCVILEIPSWPGYSNPGTPFEKFLAWVDRGSRRHLHRHVDRILTFSREPVILGIPTIRSDNGVDVHALGIHLVPARDGQFRLLGLANLSFWHGYDRVIEGLARYREQGGDAPVHFDVVGNGSELDRLKRLAADHALTPYVHFHGSLRGAALDAIVAHAHMGVSSIGMHRLEVDTSNLKSREFCARGLPFVIGYPDRDFPPSLPFVFHAPADDSPVDIEMLVQFFERLASEHPDYPTEMRAYAQQHLSWRSKMRPVTSEIRTILATNEART